jgi:hypothetical protein
MEPHRRCAAAAAELRSHAIHARWRAMAPFLLAGTFVVDAVLDVHVNGSGAMWSIAFRADNGTEATLLQLALMGNATARAFVNL